MSVPSKEEMTKALEERHGKEIQNRISRGSAAICGLGGLGSNIAVSLARAGIGRLHLIDFDCVDISNLNRQQYLASQIGMPKTEALRQNIHKIAPYVEIDTDHVRITPDNAGELLKNETIICEAFDKADQKAMLVNCILEMFPDKYLISGSGMAGINSANSIHTRKITEHFYLCGDEISDISDGQGLFPSRVAVCAAHQAHMVLRILAGESTP
ncbi:MAG: sulfur carrier protein ThiS adenylyltransferase ThiF [Porcipelethomonas sp.]